jgi:hypothetical protein
VQSAVVRPNVEPYLPAGHGVHAAVSAPPVEYEPGEHWPLHVDAVEPAALP